MTDLGGFTPFLIVVLVVGVLAGIGYAATVLCGGAGGGLVSIC